MFHKTWISRLVVAIFTIYWIAAAFTQIGGTSPGDSTFWPVFYIAVSGVFFLYFMIPSSRLLFQVAGTLGVITCLARCLGIAQSISITKSFSGWDGVLSIVGNLLLATAFHLLWSKDVVNLGIFKKIEKEYKQKTPPTRVSGDPSVQ